MPFCTFCGMPNESGASTCCLCGNALNSNTNAFPITAAQAEIKRGQLISELEKLHADWKKARIEQNQVEQNNAQAKADKLIKELLELDDRFPPETNYKRQHLLCSYVPFPKKFYPQMYGKTETPQQTAPATSPAKQVSPAGFGNTPQAQPAWKPSLPSSNRYASHADVIYNMSKEIAKKTVELLKLVKWPNQKVGERGDRTFAVTVHDEYVRITYHKSYKYDYWPIGDGTVYLYYSSFGMGNIRYKEPLLDALQHFLRTEFPSAVHNAFSNIRGVRFTPTASLGQGGDGWIMGDLADMKYIDLRLQYYVCGDPNLTAW